MSKQFITVTVVSTNLKEEVLDELITDNFKGEDDEEDEGPTDENGKTKKFYLELGILEKNLPDFFKNQPDSKQKKIINLTDPALYDYVARQGKVKPKLIDFVIDNEDKGAKLFLVTGHTIRTEESAEEIEAKIEKFYIKRKNELL